MKRWKRQKKKNHIGVWIILIIMIALISMAVWQRANIKTVMLIKSSPEEIKADHKKSEQIVKEALEAGPEIKVRDLTEEEKEAFKKGELSESELIEMLVGSDPFEISDDPDIAVDPDDPGISDITDEPGDPTNPKPTTSSKPTTSPKPTEEAQPSEDPKAAKEKAYKEELSRLVAEVYVLRQSYDTKLDDLLASAKSEYVSKRNNGYSKQELVPMAYSYISKANSLEKQCDSEFETIMDKMEILIDENGGDASIPDTIRASYEEEKAERKAEYMALAREKGIF